MGESVNTTTDNSMRANIFAAGAVLWRPVGGTDDIEIAVVHRPRYDDWSMPKGKLDPGETAVAAAVREVEEETGFASTLGRYLGKVTYPVVGHRKLKRVDYWSARCGDGRFVPNHEVDELRWLRPRDAFAQLSYPMDCTVLRRFLAQPADTDTVLIVRHAKAGSRKKYRGDDADRPLDPKGREQADALVAQLGAFGADTVVSADRVRCIRTVEPFAQSRGITVDVDPALSEEAFAADPDRTRARILEIAKADGTPAVSSQGKVIPDLIRWWADRDGVRLPAARNRKASMWVLSLRDGRLVAADHIDSPLPASRP